MKSTEHNCEVPGWRCYGNGPIVLETAIVKCIGLELFHKTEVNYCPFCGLKSESEDATIR